MEKCKKTIYGCSLVIIGDSYSTFEGWIPKGFASYYPNISVPSIENVEQTWWKQLMNKFNLKLIKNDSWSGSTVSKSVRPDFPEKSAFIERMKITLSGEIMPELIIIFGGTNDSWLNNPHGSNQFDRWSDRDDKMTLPAFCHLFNYICTHNPNAQVVCVVNTDLNPQLETEIPAACRKYGIVCVRLHEIDKEYGHPTARGMSQIAEQIGNALK